MTAISNNINMTKIECEIWENKISCFTKAHREKVTIL